MTNSTEWGGTKKFSINKKRQSSNLSNADKKQYILKKMGQQSNWSKQDEEKHNINKTI